MWLGKKKCTQPKPILLASGWEPEKTQCWLIFSSLSLCAIFRAITAIHPAEWKTPKISELRPSSAAFLQICCVCYGYQKERWKSISRHLVVSDAFTITSSTWLVEWKQHPILLKRYFWPTFVTCTDLLHHQLVLMLRNRLVPPSLSPDRKTGGLLPSTWEEAPLQSQMHEVASVSSGQYCHCWLSEGSLTGLFPIVFPRTCPKMFPSKPPSRKTPAEEQRTIAHKVPSSIAISRISAVTFN